MAEYLAKSILFRLKELNFSVIKTSSRDCISGLNVTLRTLSFDGSNSKLIVRLL